ncbi:tyrosine--tRNA ligase [Candidatus Kaiserbacteria bacterium]|nr:tyrosine--tRNA ligase [Candidatus Kaiserbacteria bacterium]
MMNVSTDAQKIEALLSRGVVEIIHEESLRKKLQSGTQLRIKLGIDPTSPNLHIGRAIPLLKLRDFQELGHQIVLIVGDFTAVIGDTSDKDSERPMLARDVIEENKKAYLDQAGKLLDLDKIEFRYNSEWLGPLDYNQIGEHADQFSVADFIARDNIKRRLDAGKRVSLREVLYPLMQGYDSVAIKADVELGGTDQRFNLLAGRVLQEHFGQEAQNIIIGPLINGLDGRKMSSSWGNTINLTAEPADMYGKVMSMQDGEILTYFELCTRVPMSRIDDMRDLLNGAEISPRDAKMELAKEIVTLYHGADAAGKAEEAFVETFQKRNPFLVEEVVRREGETYADALVRTEIVSSKSELSRLLDAGAVSDTSTGEKYDTLPDTPGATLKIGKRRFVRFGDS